MKTSVLIDCLVADPVPRTMTLVRCFWLALGLGVLAAAVLFVVGVGPRSDFVSGDAHLEIRCEICRDTDASIRVGVPLLPADAPGRTHWDVEFVAHRTFLDFWNGEHHGTVSCAVGYVES